MGQFKPMVKMMTTEPSIELKLKKGGHVAMPKMKSKDNGTGSKKMADGGMSGVLARAGLPPGPVGGASPAAPSMAARRKAMMGRKKMAEGGESAAEHKAEMKKMEGTAKELKKHESMPASKAHKGLKTGGVAMGQGGYANGGIIKSTKGETMMHTAKPDHSPAKTGGVKMGNAGGYKKGGNVKMASGGMPGMPFTEPSASHIANATSQLRAASQKPSQPTASMKSLKPLGLRRFAKGGGVEGNVSTTPPGVSNTKTGGVRKGNAGGYKKGGALKKFAEGGSVNDSGKAVKMPQKSPPTPVSINRLSGTYKKGGKVKKYAEGGDAISESQAKARERFDAEEAAENRAEREAVIGAIKNPLEAIRSLPERLKKGYEALKEGVKGSGSVTTTEREVSRTVTPAKKRYGGAC